MLFLGRQPNNWRCLLCVKANISGRIWQRRLSAKSGPVFFRITLYPTKRGTLFHYNNGHAPALVEEGIVGAEALH